MEAVVFLSFSRAFRMAFPRARRAFSFPRAPFETLSLALEGLSLSSLSSLISLSSAHNVCFYLEKGAQLRTSRTSAHNPFVRVFVCLCVQPALWGGGSWRGKRSHVARISGRKRVLTWRVFPARTALHNIPKFTKIPNITILPNKLIVTTMHPL